MADPAALALQKAVVARLLASPGVSALVAGRVHDEPPQGVAFPYVRIGQTDQRALRMDCHTDDDVLFSVECHSRPDAGRVEAMRIAQAVREALDDAPLTVAGHVLDWMDYTALSVTRAPDGRSYVAVVAFAAALAPA